MHHQIDALAYTNRLRYLPPEHKLGFAIALFLLGYAAPPLGQALIATWMVLWTVGYAQIPAAVYLKLLLLPLGFWLTSVPALLIGVASMADLATLQSDILQGVPLGSIYLYLSLQGLQQAETLFLRALALTTCLYFIVLTVPFVEILRVLRRVGCPSLVTELLALMYRFIFVLAETATELVTAQRSRGGYRTWRLRLRSLGLIAGQLLWRTLENARQLSLGLQSRGFTGELRVWHGRRHKPNGRYSLEAVSGCLLLLFYVGWHYAHGL